VVQAQGVDSGLVPSTSSIDRGPPEMSDFNPTAVDPVESLILDLLEWIGPASRPYAEVMDAWRTSCPRLPVWEEANDRGFIEYRAGDDGMRVAVAPAGREHLAHRRPSRQAVSQS